MSKIEWMFAVYLGLHFVFLYFHIKNYYQIKKCEEQTRSLYFSAGLISTMEQYKDLHPEAVLQMLLAEGKKKL